MKKKKSNLLTTLYYLSQISSGSLKIIGLTSFLSGNVIPAAAITASSLLFDYSSNKIKSKARNLK